MDLLCRDRLMTPFLAVRSRRASWRLLAALLVSASVAAAPDTGAAGPGSRVQHHAARRRQRHHHHLQQHRDQQRHKHDHETGDHGDGGADYFLYVDPGDPARHATATASYADEDSWKVIRHGGQAGARLSLTVPYRYWYGLEAVTSSQKGGFLLVEDFSYVSLHTGGKLTQFGYEGGHTLLNRQALVPGQSIHVPPTEGCSYWITWSPRSIRFHLTWT
jgi:Ni/Co efflux regulator RcnB